MADKGKRIRATDDSDEKPFSIQVPVQTGYPSVEVQARTGLHHHPNARSLQIRLRRHLLRREVRQTLP
ncbi:hypothetical protein OROMI_008910 [Orobanche minor]